MWKVYVNETLSALMQYCSLEICNGKYSHFPIVYNAAGKLFHSAFHNSSSDIYFGLKWKMCWHANDQSPGRVFSVKGRHPKPPLVYRVAQWKCWKIPMRLACNYNNKVNVSGFDENERFYGIQKQLLRCRCFLLVGVKCEFICVYDYGTLHRQTFSNIFFDQNSTLLL